MIKILPLILVALTQPALAQSTDDLAQAELLPGWRTDTGTHMAALHLRLAPDWKTYWRAPGDAGIPPLFDWAGSENIGSVTFHWPRPQVFDLNGMQTIGYLTDLVLPFEVTPAVPGQPVHLAAQVDLGICKDICVPASFTLTATLPADPQTPSPQITRALADRPVPGASAGLASVTCQVAPIADGLRVTATLTLPPLPTAETVIIEPGTAGGPAIWVSDTVVTRNGDTLTATADMVPGDGAPLELDQSLLVLTVLAADQAVEIIGCPPR